MINKPPPFKGLDIMIPAIIPMKGRGFINHGSGLWVQEGDPLCVQDSKHADKMQGWASLGHDPWGSRRFWCLNVSNLPP